MFDDLEVFPLEKPALRPLDIFPARTPQGEVLVVQDPMGLLPGPAVMMPDPLLLVFLQMADGNTSLGEMAQTVTMQTGQIIPEGMFQSIAEQLDEALLLQTESFRDALREKYEDFMASPVRPIKSFDAGQKDRLKMLKDLGEEMRRHKMSSLSPPQRIDLPAESVSAILAPHIDYKRGGEAYAWAYQALKQRGRGAKTFIILGTSHRPASHRFVASRKDYETPFGKLETDKELLDELATEFGGELFRDEWLHADEHTVELNAAYLRHTLSDDDIKIVPILVGSFDDFLILGRKPEEDGAVAKFVKALRTILERHGDKVALIGGVDFSHCGPEFGDEQTNEPEREKEIEESDRLALQEIEEMDTAGFLDHFRQNENEQKVCSVGTMYVVMAAMEGLAKAKVLSYQQANSNDKNCLVSFASVAFLKEGVAEEKPAAKIILLS